MAAALAALLLVTAGCSGPEDTDRDTAAELTVSYRASTAALAALDGPEVTEQLRDWARLGLAAALGLGADRTAAATYESPPIRDGAFAELLDQQTGPGRGLFDGGTLHVLVPQDDPHRSRTIGLALDQHRADAGSDPGKVQVHRYRIAQEQHRIEVASEPAAGAGEVRAANGWREARVDQAEGLAGFLGDTSHLARLEKRGEEVWASGWRWPGAPGARVSAADVAVLQRGYLRTSGPLPGFSLDPRPVADPADLRATVPGLDPRLVAAIFTGNFAGTGYASVAELRWAVSVRLFQPEAESEPAPGLPADRTQLWALRSALDGGPVFSQARFDGGLAGTEAGFTLFYVDLVAKSWTTGVGQGVPVQAVPGFVPNPKAPVPPSLCVDKPKEESGRLWFGVNDAALTHSPTGLAIGAKATRLFSRVTGADGTEVEPSHSFARGLNWWDRNYLQVADYEPQFSRADQLMRWSAALEWLTTQGRGRLAVTAPEAEPGSFADWYARHGELRERGPLALVAPPSATGESVLPIPSETTQSCGLYRISGGVSLADGLTRSRGKPSGTEALPEGIRRASPVDPAKTQVDPATGSARFDRVSRDNQGEIADRTTVDLRRGPDGSSVRITGAPRESLPFAGAPLRGEHPNREYRTTFQTEGKDLVVEGSYQQVSTGTVRVKETPSSGARPEREIIASPGQAAHLREAIKRVSGDPAQGLTGAPGVRYQYQGPEGQTIYRYGNGWIEVGVGPTSSRVLAESTVATPAGPRQVRLVVPSRLSEVDVSAVRVVSEKTGTLKDVQPADALVYQADTAALVGTDKPGAPPVAIPVEAKIRIRVVRVTGEAGSPGLPGGPNRSWRLSNQERPGAAVTGGVGPLGSGGGVRVEDDWRGIGGLLVLLSVCQEPTEREPNAESCP
ncbi:hypothetical protein GCM10010452_50290 [Crossiella cryophila]